MFTKAIILDGWRYEIDYNTKPISFKIIPAVEFPIPSTLYKYLSLNNTAISLFKDFKLFFTEVSKLNDPYDCSYNLFQYYGEPIEFFIQQYQGSTEPIVKYLIDNKDFYSLHREFLLKIEEMFFEIFGVVSLTGYISSVPMWAYYSSNQEGFALGYNTKKFKEQINLSGPFPTHYKKIHDRPNFKDFKHEFSESYNDIDFGLSMLYCSNIKSYQWKEEKEWRYICRIPNDSIKTREKPYNPKILDEIVFGLRFFNPNRRGIGINDIRENPNETFYWSDDKDKRDIKREILINALKHNIPMSCMIFNTVAGFSIIKWPITAEFINDYEVKVTYENV